MIDLAHEKTPLFFALFAFGHVRTVPVRLATRRAGPVPSKYASPRPSTQRTSPFRLRMRYSYVRLRRLWDRALPRGSSKTSPCRRDAPASEVFDRYLISGQLKNFLKAASAETPRLSGLYSSQSRQSCVEGKCRQSLLASIREFQEGELDGAVSVVWVQTKLAPFLVIDPAQMYEKIRTNRTSFA
jgi:hypothetical protein